MLYLEITSTNPRHAESDVLKTFTLDVDEGTGASDLDTQLGDEFPDLFDDESEECVANAYENDKYNVCMPEITWYETDHADPNGELVLHKWTDAGLDYYDLCYLVEELAEAQGNYSNTVIDAALEKAYDKDQFVALLSDFVQEVEIDEWGESEARQLLDENTIDQLSSFIDWKAYGERLLTDYDYTDLENGSVIIWSRS